ncbi:tumor necrosis factor ligand superfamily member 13B-like [Cololabis saira]|uniref:tumor necrosis factor ligand superfamily member 13B-like n=1 Tax=Cololabis saira TaxID=129043 RepID=UPI002AD35324|nr:tumor necrosis factor ligand superfamily member 13B-like [Cololabis saira]
MLYNALLSLTAFMFCLSLFLLQRASDLESDFHKLRGDIILQLNQQRSEGVNGKMAKMAKTREDVKPSVFKRAQSPLESFSRRVKREQSSCRAPASFLQLRANTNKQPDIRGNITLIPWTVSAQQGNTISQRENRIVVQEDGYYLVFGQVLFESPSTVLGHVIRSWSATEAGKVSTELLRCLQEMPDKTPVNTCYAAGTVQLSRDEELEMVIPHRPAAIIAIEADSTFFGVIRLN